MILSTQISSTVTSMCTQVASSPRLIEEFIGGYRIFIAVHGHLAVHVTSNLSWLAIRLTFVREPCLVVNLCLCQPGDSNKEVQQSWKVRLVYSHSTFLLLYPLSKPSEPPSCGFYMTRTSLDSLCRDGVDAQYRQYLRKSCITSLQIR